MENKNTNVGNNTADQTNANIVLADVLLEQLDKWINDCQLQADSFFERRMTIRK